MKTRPVLVSALCLALCLAVPLRAEDEAHTMLDGLGRGVANLLTGVIEIPRCTTFYGFVYPVIGVIPGVIQGTGMAGYRVVGGGIDLITLGLLPPGRTVYDIMEIPLLPWEAPWVPPEDYEAGY